jgi:hypothetical protein
VFLWVYSGLACLPPFLGWGGYASEGLLVTCSYDYLKEVGSCLHKVLVTVSLKKSSFLWWMIEKRVYGTNFADFQKIIVRCDALLKVLLDLSSRWHTLKYHFNWLTEKTDPFHCAKLQTLLTCLWP